MEEKNHVISIAVPEGKTAKWNEDGMLQLVDATPDVLDPTVPITERVKTFMDAIKIIEAKGDPDGLIKEWNTINFKNTKNDLRAFLMLGIIVAALNDGWKPSFKEGEQRWCPYMILYTKSEIEDMPDADKDDICLQLWFAGGGSSDGSYCGLGCSLSDLAWSSSYSNLSARLVLKSEQLALYCGKQFIRLWSQYYCGRDCKPWREIDFTDDDNENDD